MPRYRVIIHKHAEKDLKDLPGNVLDRFEAVFEMLEEDPYRPRPGCDIRILKGHPRIRAVRVGEYRGIYEVVEAERTVWFTRFGHRRNIYGRR